MNEQKTVVIDLFQRKGQAYKAAADQSKASRRVGLQPALEGIKRALLDFKEKRISYSIARDVIRGEWLRYEGIWGGLKIQRLDFYLSPGQSVTLCREEFLQQHEKAASVVIPVPLWHLTDNIEMGRQVATPTPAPAAKRKATPKALTSEPAAIAA